MQYYTTRLHALLNVRPPLNIRPPKLPFEKLNAQGVLSGVYGTLFCNECPKRYCHLVAKFPSNSNAYHNARMESPIHVAEAL